MRPVEKKLALPQDHAQQIIEIVRNATRQPSDGLKLLQLKDMLLQALALPVFLRVSEFALDGRDQALQVGFNDVVLSAFFERGNSDIFTHGSGNENEWGVASHGSDESQCVSSGEPGHGKVGQHKIPSLRDN